MILNVEVLIPDFIEKNDSVWKSTDNYKLTSADSSLIISIFSIAALLMAPLNTMMKATLGAKNALVVGFLLLTVTTFGLGVIKHVTNPHVFKWIALLLRFL